MASTEVKWNQSEIEAIRTKFMRGMVKMGFAVANRARFSAPYKTGALRNSIRVNELGNSVEVMAGGEVFGKSIPYALIHEEGGRTGRNYAVTIRAKHYLRNALKDTLRGDFSKFFKEAA